MVEEGLVPGAQVVEPGLTVGRLDEAVLGAAAVAGEPDVARAAVGGQGVALVEPEAALLFGRHELGHRGLRDVAELVRLLDEVVARVEVAVVLQGEGGAAGLRVDAQRRRLAVPAGQGDVEHLDVDLADVAADPLLEDPDEERAVLVGRDRPIGDQAPLLAVERSIAPRSPGRGPGQAGRQPELGERDVDPGRGQPLDDGDELHEPRAALVAQEPVDLRPGGPRWRGAAWSACCTRRRAPGAAPGRGAPGRTSARRPGPPGTRRASPGGPSMLIPTR